MKKTNLEYYYQLQSSDSIIEETVIELSDPHSITWIRYVKHSNGAGDEGHFTPRKFSGGVMNFIQKHFQRTHESTYNRVRTSAMNAALAIFAASTTNISEPQKPFKLIDVTDLPIDDLRTRLYLLEREIAKAPTPEVISMLQIERQQILDEVFNRARPLV